MTARMLRGLGLTVALTAVLAGPAHAASVTSGQITGRVLRTVLVGDTIVDVRQPDRGRARLELRAPGAPVKDLAELPKGARRFELAASAQAIAVASYAGEEYDDYYETRPTGATQVLVGPPGGPFREVASCPRAYGPSAVAVDGTHVAWADGGCAGPTQPTEVGPAAIALADADPAVAVQRVPVPQDSLATSLTLQGDHGTVGVLRPTFFGVSTDVRTFAPAGLSDPRVRASGLVSAPFGQLPDGSVLVFRLRSGLLETNYDDYGEEDRCPSSVGVAAPGADVQAGLGVGGCPALKEFRLTSPAVLAGSDVVAPIDVDDEARWEQLYRRDRTLDLYGLDVLRVTRTPVGGKPVELARTDFRAVDDVSADGPRTAFTAIRCAGGTQITVTDAPLGLLADCSGAITTRRARVVKGTVALTVSCPRGCSGALVDDSYCGRRSPTAFHLGPGKHVVRLHPQVRTLRGKRLLVRLKLRGAPSPRQVVRLVS